MVETRSVNNVKNIRTQHFPTLSAAYVYASLVREIVSREYSRLLQPDHTTVRTAQNNEHYSQLHEAMNVFTRLFSPRTVLLRKEKSEHT